MHKPTHVVVRPFDAEGRTLRAGELVDASGWKNVAKLSLDSVNYLRPVTERDLENWTPSPTSRKLASADSKTRPPTKVFPKKFFIKKK